MISSTNDSRPRISCKSWPSFRLLSDIRPASFNWKNQKKLTEILFAPAFAPKSLQQELNSQHTSKEKQPPAKEKERHTISTAAVHSSTVISFSLAKSCKCLSKLGITCASLALAFGPVAAITESVNVGLKREVLVESAAPALPPSGTLGPDSSGTRFRGSATIVGDGGSGMPGRMRRWCLEGGGGRKKSLMAPRMRRRVEDW